MKKESAEKIHKTVQGCIELLSVLMRDIKDETSKEEFDLLKTEMAQAMGRLIDIEEANVYRQYPELRPYELG